MKCCYTSHRQIHWYKERQWKKKKKQNRFGAGDTNHECDPNLSAEQTHTQNDTKIFKKGISYIEGVTMVIICCHKVTDWSDKHETAEISCRPSWAGPLNSHGGRRWIWTRCFPKDKRCINKQRMKRDAPFLPVISLYLDNNICVCVCVGDGTKSQANELWL